MDDGVFEVLASAHGLPLRSLLLGGCKQVGPAGVRCLSKAGGQLLARLLDLDLSRNRQIDNQCVEMLYGALLGSEDGHKGEREHEDGEQAEPHSLRLYVTQTGVQEELADKLWPRIELIF